MVLCSRTQQRSAAASASYFAAAMIAELQSLPNVQLLTRTTVFSWYDDMVFGAVERVQ